jgi:hypothetical protein
MAKKRIGEAIPPSRRNKLEGMIGEGREKPAGGYREALETSSRALAMMAGLLADMARGSSEMNGELLKCCGELARQLEDMGFCPERTPSAAAKPESANPSARTIPEPAATVPPDPEHSAEDDRKTAFLKTVQTIAMNRRNFQEAMDALGMASGTGVAETGREFAERESSVRDRETWKRMLSDLAVLGQKAGSENLRSMADRYLHRDPEPGRERGIENFLSETRNRGG